MINNIHRILLSSSDVVESSEGLIQAVSANWAACLVACLLQLKRWFNEASWGSCLATIVIKFTRKHEAYGTNVHRPFSPHCHPAAVQLMFFLGLTFLQGCLCWMAGCLWRRSQWKSWAHSPCLPWFVLLCFVLRPWRKGPVNESHRGIFQRTFLILHHWKNIRS